MHFCYSLWHAHFVHHLCYTADLHFQGIFVQKCCLLLLRFFDQLCKLHIYTRAVLCGANYRSIVKLRKSYIRIFLKNAAYVCQTLLDSVKAFERYKQKCALASFFGLSCIFATVFQTIFKVFCKQTSCRNICHNVQNTCHVLII